MSHARRWAVGAGALLVGLTVAPVGPTAAANGEWEIVRWGIEKGASVTGEVWTIAGTISAPFPSDVITDLEFNLTRVDEHPGCPNLSRNLHIRDGDDADFEGEPTTTTTTPSSTTTAPPARLDEYRFRFDVIPRCNGRYHLNVVGTADRPALTPADVSDELWLGDPSNPDDAVLVGLRPPDVVGTTATVGEGRAITVSWRPPPIYEDDIGGPPPDLVGYAIEYSNDNGTTWRGFEATRSTTYSHTESLPNNLPAGNYHFRVRGIRTAVGFGEGAVFSPGGDSAVALAVIGAAPPPVITAPPTSRGGGGGGQSAGQGPTTTFDEGFSETIDYSDLLEDGDEEATLPDDAASFLDFIPERTGSAVLVPFAIAECLAVWALHLRYLARRVDGG